MGQTKWKRQMMAASIGAVMLFTSTAQVFAAATPSDVQGHWAQSTLTKWVQEGKIKGYQDGTLKPNNPASRAELIVMINQALQLQGDQNISFKDVTSNKWYYSALRTAVANHYIGGYEDQTFRPNQEVTREQLAVIVARLLQLTVSESALKYEDTKSLPVWSRGLIGAIVDSGIMSANAKGLFQPSKPATRAEVMVVMDRVSKLYSNGQSITFSRAGTYGPDSDLEEVKGDVKVETGGVILRNYSINKNLILQAGIGEGDVDLQGVTVKGNTLINGGGPNSIRIADSTLAGVTVNKENGRVRIVASGKTSVGALTLQSGAIVTETGLTGTGFGAVSISRDTPANAVIQLDGSFTDIEIDAPGITLQIAVRGQVKTLHILTGGIGATVELPEGAGIGTFQSDASAQVTGKGTIAKAILKVSGVKLEMKPGQMELAPGVTATVNGSEVAESNGAGTTPGGISPGGGGGNDGAGEGDGDGEQPIAKRSASEVFPSAVTVHAGIPITLSQAPSAGTKAWFAPEGTSRFAAGATMTELAGDGVAKIMITPSTAGTYKLFVVDSSSAILSTSTAILTVEGIVSNQEASALYSADKHVRGGSSITLTTVPDNGLEAWLAPSGTEDHFSAGANMTIAAGTTIVAPAAEGDYRLFLVENATGKARNTSVAVLHVDNTAPKNNVTPSISVVKGGKSIHLGALGSDVASAWIAPPGTTEFVSSSTMTQTTGSSIAAPASEGSYKLYLRDLAGNVSVPSIWTLTVVNTAPNTQNALFNASKSVKGGAVVNLTGSVGANEQAWLAPADTTVFKVSPTIVRSTNGSSFIAPLAEGAYRLFVIDVAGNVSAASSAVLTVDNTAPTIQNVVFSADKLISISSGDSVSLNSLPIGVTAWFAPAVTSVFVEGHTMSKAVGGSNTIAAPTTPAIYKLFLIDEAGNVSLPSNATLTVTN